MERKITVKERFILFVWIIVTIIQDNITYAGNFTKSRLRLIWSRLWIRKNEFHNSLNYDYDFHATATPSQLKKYQADLGKRRAIAHQKDREGPMGKKLRQELLQHLNRGKCHEATTIVDRFALKKDVKTCTRFSVPYKGSLNKWYLDVYLDDLNISFIYSGCISKKWRNSYSI